MVNHATIAVVIQIYEVVAPIAREPMMVLHEEVFGSVTCTFVRSTSPVLVTVIVNVTVLHDSTSWSSGVFSIWMAGRITITCADEVAHTTYPHSVVHDTEAILVYGQETHAC